MERYNEKIHEVRDVTNCNGEWPLLFINAIILNSEEAVIWEHDGMITIDVPKQSIYKYSTHYNPNINNTK